MADAEASYPFADALFNEIVDRSGPEIEVFDAWDPVARELEIAETGSYDYDSRDYLAANGLGVIDYDDRDSSEFRNYWLYMPQFRILDQNDFVTTMAVFLVLFIFIALIFVDVQFFHLHRHPCFLCRSNVSYLFGDRWSAQTAYKLLALVMLFIGGLAAYTFVWDLGDVGVGLMTIFNLIALLPMSNEAIESLKDYERRRN